MYVLSSVILQGSSNELNIYFIFGYRSVFSNENQSKKQLIPCYFRPRCLDLDGVQQNPVPDHGRSNTCAMLPRASVPTPSKCHLSETSSFLFTDITTEQFLVDFILTVILFKLVVPLKRKIFFYLALSHQKLKEREHLCIHLKVSVYLTFVQYCI